MAKTLTERYNYYPLAVGGVATVILPLYHVSLMWCMFLAASSSIIAILSFAHAQRNRPSIEEKSTKRYARLNQVPDWPTSYTPSPVILAAIDHRYDKNVGAKIEKQFKHSHAHVAQLRHQFLTHTPKTSAQDAIVRTLQRSPGLLELLNDDQKTTRFLQFLVDQNIIKSDIQHSLLETHECFSDIQVTGTGKMALCPIVTLGSMYDQFYLETARNNQSQAAYEQKLCPLTGRRLAYDFSMQLIQDQQSKATQKAQANLANFLSEIGAYYDKHYKQYCNQSSNMTLHGG